MPAADHLLFVSRPQVTKGLLVLAVVAVVATVAGPLSHVVTPSYIGDLLRRSGAYSPPVPTVSSSPLMTVEDLEYFRSALLGMAKEVTESQGTQWAKCGLALIERGFNKRAMVIYVPEKSKAVLFSNVDNVRAGGHLLVQTGGSVQQQAYASTIFFSARLGFTGDVNELSLSGEAAVCLQRLHALYAPASALHVNDL